MPVVDVSGMNVKDEKEHWDHVKKIEQVMKMKVKVPTTQEELNKLLDRYSKIVVAIDHVLDQTEKKTKELNEKILKIQLEHERKHEVLMIKKQKIMDAILKSSLVTDIIKNELNEQGE